MEGVEDWGGFSWGGFGIGLVSHDQEKNRHSSYSFKFIFYIFPKGVFKL